eukprot:10396114-Ditylum_brightwellii.AAC.2
MAKHEIDEDIDDVSCSKEDLEIGVATLLLAEDDLRSFQKALDLLMLDHLNNMKSDRASHDGLHLHLEV